MKIKFLLAFLTSLIIIAAPTHQLAAASSMVQSSTESYLNAHVAGKASANKHFKKEKRSNRLKAWWSKQTNRLRQAWHWIQRISLGFVGFLVMLVGGLFILLGLVIPYLGILFLVLGIIIAFVGLLLWLVLSRVGVSVSNGGNGSGRRPR